MDKKLLPRNFFRDNPLDKMSAPLIAHFSMTAGFNEKLQNAIWDILEGEIEPERKARIEEEKAEIARLETGDAIVKFIRNDYDIANRETLCKKILTMQAEVLPPLLCRFQTSFQDSVTETTVYILGHAEREYVDQLIEMYPEIRNPYAQSMACVALGVQEREDTLPLLLREYERLKRQYPEESYCQGPLLAIYILYGKA